MSQTVYDDTKQFLEAPSDKTLVWHIPDKDGIYPHIRQKVDALLEEILIIDT